MNKPENCIMAVNIYLSGLYGFNNVTSCAFIKITILAITELCYGDDMVIITKNKNLEYRSELNRFNKSRPKLGLLVKTRINIL